MQNCGNWRPAAFIAPLLFLGAGMAVACRDAGAPSNADEWAGQTLVSMKVRTEITGYGSGKPQQVGSSTTSIPMVVFPDGRKTGATFSRAATKGHNIRVRHFKDNQGRVLSVGLVHDGTGRPPTLAYLFENGKIRTILSSAYQRHGRGWVRLNSRITYFDSTGRPQFQAIARPEQSAQSDWDAGRIRLAKAGADILALTGKLLFPKQLHAEEAGCVTEWLAYSAASFVVASASIALAAVETTCTAGGPVVAAVCAEKLMATWLAAVAAWSLTLDKLVLCQEKQPGTAEGGDGGAGSGDGADGSGSGSGSGGGWDGGDQYSPQPETQTVIDFINDAIAKWNFYCSESGDYCVFYSE